MNMRIAALALTLGVSMAASAGETFTDYKAALDEAKKRDVPVLVRFADDKPSKDFEDQAQKFVVLNADNSTPDGRARNRRVAIRVTSR